MREPVFEVFARKTREEPLRHIGYINATDGDLARVYAWTTYDEQNWFEMCVVPRSEILSVNRTESSYHAAAPVDDRVVHSEGPGSYGGSDVATEGSP